MRARNKTVRAELVEALPLLPHETSAAAQIRSLTISIERQSPHKIWLRYHLEMPLDELALPDPADPERVHGLWETTCFELFLRRPDARAYAEYNLSPSSRWAAYRFDDVRKEMAPLDIGTPPKIHLDASDSHFAVETTIDLPPEWQGHDLEIGIAAVIEQVDGSKSYWALAHPADRPDFHHPVSFILRLPRP